MPSIVWFVLGGIGVLGLLGWSLRVQWRRNREQKTAFERLGFYACPEEAQRIEKIVAEIENNRKYRYGVRDLRCLPGDTPVYYYVKTRQSNPDDASAEEEILFPRKRSTDAGALLVLKPSSLGAGMAARTLGALATEAWDAQPDDLVRIDIPRELRNSNLIGAMGPQGAALHDLVDSQTVSVVQGLGDAGAILARFRGGWGSVAGTSSQIPFRVDEIVARLRPIL